MKIHFSVFLALTLLGDITAGIGAPSAIANDEAQSSAIAAPTYSIRLARPTVVGTTYRMIASGSDEKRMDMTIDGQALAPRSSVVTVEITAVGEVLALTPSGREMKARLVIEKATGTAAGQSGELLLAGTEIIAENIGGKTNFLIGGVQVKPEVAKLLEIAGVSMESDEDVTDDDLFGTKEQKSVGDSWSINAAATAADLVKQGLPVNPSNLSGTVTLAEVIKSGEQELLRVAAAIKVRGVIPPAPTGFSVQYSEWNGSFSGLYPVEVDKRVNQQSVSLASRFVFSGTEKGKKAVVTMIAKGTHTVRFMAKDNR